MKNIFFALLIITCGCQAQYDSTKVVQQNNAYGFSYNVIAARNALIVPSDTPRLKANVGPAISVFNGNMYLWTGNFWRANAGASKLNDSTIILGSDTVIIAGVSGASKTYVDSLFATLPNNGGTVYKDDNLMPGPTNDPNNPFSIDTTNWIATKTDAMKNRDSLGRAPGIDSIRVFRDGVHLYSIKDSSGAAGSGLTSVTHDATLTGLGTVPGPLKVDTSAGKIATKTDIANIPTIPYPDFFSTSTIQVTGNDTVGYQWTVQGAPGTNPQNALNILDFGGQRNGIIPSSGSVPTGFSNTAALNSMLSFAADGQVCIIPYGNFVFSTVPDTILGPKRVILVIYGNTYHINSSGQGIDFIILKNGSGAFEQHAIYHYGLCVGKINMVSHTKNATTGVRSSPAWNTFTGVPFKVYNTYQQFILTNKVEGFKSPSEIIGNDYDSAGRGSQENTILGRWWYKNAHGALLTSLNGRSYCDKNIYRGWGGGQLRVSGGLSLKIDGYSGVAYNGEVYNGAFRSNEFHFLVEQTDSVAECLGDITENLFDITVEGGGSTGVFGTQWFKMRSVAPNYVRSPMYTGRGVYSEGAFANGAGIDGEIHTPIWNSSVGRYYGMFALIDNEGNIVIQGSRLTQTQRNSAPANFRFAPFGQAELTVSITAPSYTLADKVAYVYYNNASATITLPSASSNVQRTVFIKNDHGVNALAVANVKSGDVASILAGQIIAFRSDGTNWRNISNPMGTGGGGGGNFINDANGQYTSFKTGFGINSSAGSRAYFAPGTASIGSFRIGDGVAPTTGEDGVFWREGQLLKFVANTIPLALVAVPDNGGTALQVIRKNAANNGHEYFTLPTFTWESNVPTVTNGPAGVIGTSPTVTARAGNTNSSGMITVTTGTFGGGLSPGSLFTVNFNVTGTSMTNAVGIVTPGNFNATGIPVSIANNSGAITLNVHGALTQSTTYVWYYMAEKK